MKSKILAKLKNTTDYVSGQELCQEFNVSRTAIWKIINKLRDEGYEIEAVSHKGYRIVNAPDILSQNEIESVVDNYKIVYKDEIDSTNNYAKRLAEDGEKEDMLIVSDCQTAGRGRNGRSFASLKGKGIFMTLLKHPKLEPQKASMVTIVTAMAVREGIFNATGLECNIKWPNDIVYDGKKVCGILTEMSAEMQNINYVVIGIGINTSNESFSEDIKDVAVSIKMTGKNTIKRSSIIEQVIKSFDKYFTEFEKTSDLEYLREEYNKYLVNAGNKVRIVAEDTDYEAIALGIDHEGRLLVNKDGKIIKIVSGEVSVRGVYGYV